MIHENLAIYRKVSYALPHTYGAMRCGVMWCDAMWCDVAHRTVVFPRYCYLREIVLSSDHAGPMQDLTPRDTTTRAVHRTEFCGRYVAPAESRTAQGSPLGAPPVGQYVATFRHAPTGKRANGTPARERSVLVWAR